MEQRVEYRTIYEDEDGWQPPEGAAIIPFPAIRRAGMIRTTAKMLAAMPEEERLTVFGTQGRTLRLQLRSIGVPARMAAYQGNDFAYALAAELVRIGVRGKFEGWLKNWKPKGLPTNRRSA
jgi:hypothetical protein